jgi:hypothetical protein
MADAFETVHTTFDRLEGEMIAEVLVRDGIDARLIGTTNAALIGAAPHILRLRIEVPRPAAAAARDLIAGLLAAAPTALDDDDDATDATDATDAAAAADAAAATDATSATSAEEPTAAADPNETPEEEAAASDAGEPAAARHPRRPLLAAGAAFVIPGGSHVYARHPWSGLVLAGGYLLALGVLLAGARHHAVVAAGGLTLAALLTADLVAGQLAVRRANLGLRASRSRQLLRGLVLVALATIVGGVAGSQVRPPPPPPPLPLLPPGASPRPVGGAAPLDFAPDLDLFLRRHGRPPASAPFRGRGLPPAPRDPRADPAPRSANEPRGPSPTPAPPPRSADPR